MLLTCQKLLVEGDDLDKLQKNNCHGMFPSVLIIVKYSTANQITLRKTDVTTCAATFIISSGPPPFCCPPPLPLPGLLLFTSSHLVYHQVSATPSTTTKRWKLVPVHPSAAPSFYSFALPVRIPAASSHLEQSSGLSAEYSIYEKITR